MRLWEAKNKIYAHKRSECILNNITISTSFNDNPSSFHVITPRFFCEAARPLARLLLASQTFVVILGGLDFSRPRHLLQFVFCFVRVQIFSGFLNVCCCPALVQYSPDSLLYFGLLLTVLLWCPSWDPFGAVAPRFPKCICCLLCLVFMPSFSGLWESHWVSVFTDN